MKKSLLALAVAAVASVASVSVSQAATVYDKDGTSLAVYGRVQAVAYSQNKHSNKSDDSSINGSSRLGLDMRSELTNGIAGFAKVEWEAANGDQDENFSSRYLWVGADFGQFGQLKAGRFEDAIKYVLKTTDIFDDWGCNGQAGNDDKRSGNVMYTWSGYGVDVNVSYGTAQDGQTVDGAIFGGAKEKLDLKNSAGIALGYTSPDVLFGPIAVKAGYNYVQFQDDTYGIDAKTGKDANTTLGAGYDSYSQWAAGLSWGNAGSGFYVAGLYQARNFDMIKDENIQGYTIGTKSYKVDDYTVSGYEFVLSYAFSNGITIRTGFENQNIDMDGGIDVDAYVIPAYVNYQVNPNFNLWVEARFDAGTDDEWHDMKQALDTYNDYTENVYSVGARYTF